ncbi:MAG: hypothetical protein WCS85_03495 [Candidatus Peribacteraceae bacterium]|jgi:hypothetical protein
MADSFPHGIPFLPHSAGKNTPWKNVENDDGGIDRRETLRKTEWMGEW